MHYLNKYYEYSPEVRIADASKERAGLLTMELGKKRKNAATLPYQAPAASSASATVSYANRKKSGVKRRQEAQDLFELSIRDRIEESDMYTQLLEFERKLDRNLTRRRADLEVATARN